MLKLKKGNKWNDWQQLGRKPLWMLSRSTKSLLTFTKVKRYKILSRVQAHIVSICFQSQDSLEVTQESADFASRQQCILLLRWTPAYWLLSILCLPLQLLHNFQHTLPDVQVCNHKVLSILWIPLPLLHNLQHTDWCTSIKYCVYSRICTRPHSSTRSNEAHDCTESLANVSSLKGQSALSAFSPPYQPRCPPIKGNLIPHQGKIRPRSKKLDQ